ncbi:transcriptional regulator, TetR family [Streptomyces sp. 2131.1]|uniref:TetR/AcrR family transcriptional regulator n=1 Tax=Streptomyces sp. 2131.1 TaxID=1855346 RepID=UPI000898C530|nr:TetR/AcrR family transcriptional regulator [Streptomyces sp. 2131.1]SED64153.1 transcriptional regulator, TetR family [Streptomyces sp. 2131.1]
MSQARSGSAEPTEGAEPEGGAAPAGDAARAGKAGGAGAPARPRRRQARGEARIAQLLKAAADVFCTTGYTAASTNAIAREAGVSPGTLYQFFPNKEAIAVELGDQLLTRWRETYGAAFLADHLKLPLDGMLDATLDPLIEFNCENPAFTVLMHGSEIPGMGTKEHDAVHVTMLARVESILAGYLPDKPPAEVTRIATMIFHVFKSGLDVIMEHEGDEREAYIRELKTVLHRYLEPMIPADTAACPDSPHTP